MAIAHDETKHMFYVESDYDLDVPQVVCPTRELCEEWIIEQFRALDPESATLEHVRNGTHEYSIRTVPYYGGGKE